MVAVDTLGMAFQASESGVDGIVWESFDGDDSYNSAGMKCAENFNHVRLVNAGQIRRNTLAAAP